ncbi:MAG: CoA-binding protein [Promethearchaeota archaeon]
MVGVSKKQNWGGTHYLEALKYCKYTGPVYPINPKYEGEEMLGFKIYGSVSSVPDDIPIDLGIVSVPAKITPSIVGELGKKGVLFAHVFASAFAEVGSEGLKLEKELIKKATESKIRILGPNCMGVYSPGGRVSFSHDSPLIPGSVAFISQSGGLAGRHLAYGISRGYHFSKIVSLGNQIDLDLMDFLRYFKEDPETKVISMYVENIKREGNDFVKLLKETTIKKPVIIWKSGVSKGGQSAVMSHTGGLAGRIELWKAMAQQTGVILVDNFYEMSNMVQTYLTYPIPKARGAAIFTGGGGLAVEATDSCEREKITVPEIPLSMQKKIGNFVRNINSNIKNPFDLAGSQDRESFYKTINIVKDDPEISLFITLSSPEHLFSIKKIDVKKYIEKLRSSLPIDLNKLLISAPALHSVSKKTYDAIVKYREMVRPYGILVYNSVGEAAKCCYKLWKYGDYLKKHKNKSKIDETRRVQRNP